MRRRQLIALGLGAAGLVAGMAVLDITIEGDGFDAADFALELLDRAVSVGAMAAVAWAIVTLRDVQADQVVLRRDLTAAVARGAEWRAANDAALEDLAGAVRRQFGAWGLTPAEADIAGLMLKGASLRDIALLRGTSETTIRQQAQELSEVGPFRANRACRLLPRVALRGAQRRLTARRVRVSSRRARRACPRGSARRP